MEYLIRRCKPCDAADIYLLNKDEMGYDYPFLLTQEKLKRLLLSESDRIYVAVCEGKIVGYVHASSYDLTYAGHMKNIMGIAVSASHQHCGIGRALLLEVEKWAIEEQAVGIRLVSGAVRTEAHAFYRRCGYSDGKEQLNFKKMF